MKFGSRLLTASRRHAPLRRGIVSLQQVLQAKAAWKVAAVALVYRLNAARVNEGLALPDPHGRTLPTRLPPGRKPDGIPGNNPNCSPTCSHERRRRGRQRYGHPTHPLRQTALPRAVLGWPTRRRPSLRQGPGDASSRGRDRRRPGHQAPLITVGRAVEQQDASFFRDCLPVQGQRARCRASQVLHRRFEAKQLFNGLRKNRLHWFAAVVAGRMMLQDEQQSGEEAGCGVTAGKNQD